MDWVYIESKYKRLKQVYDSAWDKWVDTPSSDELYQEMTVAKAKYEIFCTDVLEQLMEKNKDVLERLKNE